MRATRWLLINGAFAAALWYGFVAGIEGARNIAIFIVWLTFLTSLVACHADIVAGVAVKGRAVPKWLDLGFDVAALALLVWNGSWVLSIAYVISVMQLEVMWDRAGKLKAGGAVEAQTPEAEV